VWARCEYTPAFFKSQGNGSKLSAMNESLTSAQIVLKKTSDYEKVRDFFEKAGFTTGPMVANNFAITAPLKTFESHFDTRLESTPQGGIQAIAEEGPSLELQLESLPAAIRKRIETIIFSQPPDFGPFNP